MSAGRRIPAPDEATLSASEVGRYLYCARAWWLQRAQGYAPQNLAALARGRERHSEHGRAVAAARRWGVLLRWLVLLALFLALALLFSFLRT